MNNNEIIAKLTLGKDKTEIVKINNVDVELRPLTSGELTKIQTLSKKGLTMKVPVQGKRQTPTTNDVEVNAGELTQQQTEAMYTAVALSMGIKKEQVENMDVGIPEEIFEHVVRISNISDDDLNLIKKFRKNE